MLHIADNKLNIYKHRSVFHDITVKRKPFAERKVSFSKKHEASNLFHKKIVYTIYKS